MNRVPTWSLMILAALIVALLAIYCRPPALNEAVATPTATSTVAVVLLPTPPVAAPTVTVPPTATERPFPTALPSATATLTPTATIEPTATSTRPPATAVQRG